ncbi:hypothetical protein AB0J86_17325 [Micromonospora sp. NPDC049559]|uniref:hypothetical protein n=1 Tax=Micromonospora sp. NPDC049559 TaxID=3155923 RepID=UPI0034247BB6
MIFFEDDPEPAEPRTRRDFAGSIARSLATHGAVFAGLVALTSAGIVALLAALGLGPFIAWRLVLMILVSRDG